jgi:hypothetical protein
MSYAILRMPSSTVTVWETDMVAKIRDRVAAHSTGREAEDLILLLIQTKIDGTAAKLARLADMDAADWKPSLRAAMARLTVDTAFNRLFHLVRSAL